MVNGREGFSHIVNGRYPIIDCILHIGILQLKCWNTLTIYNGWEQVTQGDAADDVNSNDHLEESETRFEFIRWKVFSAIRTQGFLKDTVGKLTTKKAERYTLLPAFPLGF